MFDEPSAHHESSNSSFDHFSPRRSSLGSQPAWEPRVKRVGATLRSLILFCCGGALLITAAMVLDPGTLLARVRTSQHDAAASESRRIFTNTLAELVAQSHQVLAVHPRGATPYAEIVLWQTDHDNPGQIDSTEIAVISHSDLLQAVTIYTMDEQGMKAWRRGGAEVQSPEGAEAWRPGAATLQAASLQASKPSSPQSDAVLSPSGFDPAFCDRWRALPAVQPKVLASGISEMKVMMGVASVGGVGVVGSELSPLAAQSARLWLRWSSESSDASVITVSRDIRLGR